MIYKSKDEFKGRPYLILDTTALTISKLDGRAVEVKTTFGWDHMTEYDVEEIKSEALKFHLHYLDDYNSERLQDLVDSKRLMSYLKDLDAAVEREVHKQFVHQQETNKEYLRAIDDGDSMKVYQLGKTFDMFIRHNVYKEMLYS